MTEAPTILKVVVGDRSQEYQVGNLLNSIDELVCYYLHSDLNCDIEQVAAALRLYADTLDGGKVND